MAEPSKVRIGFCRALARKYLTKHRVTRPGTPIDTIVAAEGLTVLQRDWPPKASGILFRAQRVIGVNANHPNVRRRFTLAHEFGHYVLVHHLWYDQNTAISIDDPPLDGCEGSDRTIEAEANAFASEILVPLAVLKTESKRVRDPIALARAFDVSDEVMFIALQKHGLLTRL